MPKALELRKVAAKLSTHGIQFVTGGGKHPKFVNPRTGISFPVKSHGLKATIHPYALTRLIHVFNLPHDFFD
ncbi:MAG: hypothetical protein HY318_17330 [Armatimonadetes bacterium]|nr:hypothetical protein [Armatimonadota bacterium]